MSIVDDVTSRTKFLEVDELNRAFETVSCFYKGNTDFQNKTPQQVKLERVNAKKDYFSELVNLATKAVSNDLKIAEAFKYEGGVFSYKVRFKNKWKALNKFDMYGKLKDIPWQDFGYLLSRDEFLEFSTRGVSLEKVYALSGGSLELSDVLA